jgi:Tfp pilus assembly protein PilO
MATPRLQSIQSGTNNTPGVQSYVFQIIMLVVVIVLVSWFLLRPKMSEVAQSKAKIEDLTQAKETATDTINKLESLITKMNASTEDIKKLDELLPLEGRPTKVSVMLEKYVQNAGMSLANIAVESPDNKEQVVAGNHQLLDKPYEQARTQQVLEASASVTGSVEQFESLLKTLEASSRILDVQQIEIKADDEKAITFRLKILTYFYEP